MSKAEDKAKQRALEAYPVLMCYNDFQMVEEDINKPLREIYQEGYHQAEKDLELGWEDITYILDVTDAIANDDSMEERLKTMSEEEYCQEVLKRFKYLKK